MRKSDFLPFARPSIGDEEIAAVIDCMRSGWLTSGQIVERFEREFAIAIGAKHAIAVNSGTSGLHLALDALDIKSGDKLITSPYTFTASAEVMRYLGADPLFVDIDRQSFNLSTRLARREIECVDDVTAIMPIHFAGQSCDMTELSSISRDFSIPIVEDAAHALPCTHNGQSVGTIGDVSVFSFYATKTLTTGEGGMITTENDDLADRMRTMRLHGIDRNVFDRYRSDRPSWYYEVVAPGFKYNLTDIAAAIGIEQLKKYRSFYERRKAIAKTYAENFSDLPLLCPSQLNLADEHSWHLYVLQLELERLSISRDEFIERMADLGVGTSVHFIPLHIQPYWRDKYDLRPEDFPVALDVYSRAVSLPIYPDMDDEEICRVIAAVRSVIETNLK